MVVVVEFYFVLCSVLDFFAFIVVVLQHNILQYRQMVVPIEDLTNARVDFAYNNNSSKRTHPVCNVCTTCSTNKLLAAL